MSKYDRLYEFIPYLETVKIDDVVRWDGSVKSSEDLITLSYPVYSDQLTDFISLIYELDMLDTEYLDTLQSYNLHSSEEFESALINADYKLAIALLTYYVRQERFFEGLWARAVEDKIFLRLVKRLLELGIGQKEVRLE